LGEIDLESLGLPVPVTIETAKLVKQENGDIGLSGTFNGSEVSLVKDGENYELNLGNIDFKSLGLPVTINSAKLLKEASGDISLSGTFDGAEVSYQDLEDGGYELAIGKLDLKDFVEKATTVELPIDLNLENAIIKVAKGENDRNQYSISGNINGAEVTYEDKDNGDYSFAATDLPTRELTDWLTSEVGLSIDGIPEKLSLNVTPKQTEIELGKFDVSKLINGIAGSQLLSTSLELDDLTLGYSKTENQTQYTLKSGETVIDYTKKPDDYSFTAQNFSLDRIVQLVGEVGVNLNEVFGKDDSIDLTISPNKKQFSLNGDINLTKLISGLELPGIPEVSLENPSISVTGKGSQRAYEFSGKGEVDLDSFGDFADLDTIKNLLPGGDDEELKLGGEIKVKKPSSGQYSFSANLPLIGTIALQKTATGWDLAEIDDGDRLTFLDLIKISKDDELSFADLFTYDFKGDANLGLSAKTSVEGNAAFPSFNFDLAMGMPLFNYGNQTEASKQGLDIAFKNMELDLGSFLSDFAQPVISTVDDIIDPIKPVVEAINADTKLMSELGLESTFDTDGKPGVSVLEIAESLSKFGGDSKGIDTAIEFANTIEDIVSLVETLNQQQGDVIIPLGDYNLNNFKAASKDDADSATSVANQKSGSGSNSASLDTSKQNKNALNKAKSNSVFNKLNSTEGLEIPLLQNPANAVYLVLGKDVDLIKYDIPDFEFSFGLDRSFPIWGPIKGELEGKLGGKTDLAVGFDTHGINEWWKEYGFAPSKIYEVFDGFYLNDLDKDGKDKEEFSLDGEISAGIGVDVGVASASLKGGIESHVGFDLEDVGEKTGSSDGKIRGSEIISRIEKPLSLFELYGEIAAFLRGEVETILTGTVWERDFARFQLAQFRIDESGFSGSLLGGKYSTSYIAGATVFLDANLNRQLDIDEPVTKTDSNGDYNLEFKLEDYDKNGNGQLDDEEGQIVAFGGIDTSSGVPIATQMLGSVESSILTPLTSLQKFLADREYVPSNEAAEQLIARRLGVSLDNENLEDYDPIAAIGGDEGGAEQETGVDIYLAHVKVQNLIVHGNALLQGAAPNTESAAIELQALKGLADAFASGNEAFDFSNALDVESIFQKIGTESSRAIAPKTIQAAGNMVAQANALIDEMAEEAGEQTLDLVMPTVAPVKRTTQGQLAEITEKLGAGELTPEDAQSQFTTELEAGNVLEQQVINETRNVKVSATGDLDENGDDSIEIVIELGEPAPSQGVNILYNISGTATQGEDYQISGLPDDSKLYIQPGETKATLTISPIDDEISEPTEAITLNLWYAAESFVIDSEMQTAVVNIIDNEEAATAENEAGKSEAGTVGDDILIGTENPDTLSGSYGGDSIEGDAGADFLQGNHGSDTIIGGTGADIVEGNYEDDILEGNEGNDLISGGSGNDEISGDAGNDQIEGGSDNDQISGGEGNDNISGNEGDDVISGDANNDWLRGGPGNDILTGGEGQDVVNGGDGADYFVFTSPEQGLDIFVDFDPSKGDKIIIDAAGFNNPTLEDFQFLNGYLYFQDRQIALVQNEGVSYNYLSDISKVLEIQDTTTLETPVSQEVQPQETENAAEVSTRSTIVPRNKPSNFLEEILQRGYVKVGVIDNLPGHSELVDSQWQGVSIDYAKALAAALFGDENKVEFVVNGNFPDSFNKTSEKIVDVSIIDSTHNLVRDGGLNVDFSPIYLYDSQGLLVRADSGINSVLDLEGRKIGVWDNTTGPDNVRDYLEPLGIEYTLVRFADIEEMLEAYEKGEVDAVNNDRSLLSEAIKDLEEPGNHKILDEEISQEPLATILPENESEWADVVRWVTYAPVQAEEFGITANNLDQIKATTADPQIKRFLGVEGDLGPALGIPQTFTENIIKSVGNFGEIYNRNFPNLKRNRNHLSVNDGLLYSPPFAGTLPSDKELINNDERGLLQEILERGVVKVGITGDTPGFSQKDDAGNWEGFDIDIARGLAAALFGDPDKVEFVTQTFTDGFPNVANGEVDVSAMGVTHNLVRDAAMGVDFSPTYVYTGQGILVRQDSGITSLPMLNGRRIGMLEGSTTPEVMEDNLAEVGGNLVPVEFLSLDELFAAYEDGEVDAVVYDLPALSTRIPTFSDPTNHRVLDEVISKEPLALVIDENQSDWADVVRWVTYSLVQAEQFGITRDNVDEFVANSDNAHIRRLLGVEGNLGEILGLPNDYAVQIIKAVGNYGEMYDRNFDSDILRRGLNQQFTDFGLQFGHPLGTPPTVTEDEPTPTPPAIPTSPNLDEFFPQEDDDTQEEDDSVIEAADTTETEETDATTSDGDDDTDTTTDVENPFLEEDGIALRPEAIAKRPGGLLATEDNAPDEDRVMLGSDAPESLLGSSGDDMLMGMRADDMLMGYEGDDTAYGGKGNDLVMGGADSDILYGDNDDDTVSGEDGADMVNGNRGQDVIDGGSGEDRLHGGKGSDVIQGGINNDTLLGEKGNDALEGNEGDDLLDGGVGDDTLSGGQGSDRFVLAPNNGIDLILDFEDGIDSLQLEGGLAFGDLTLTGESGNTVVEFGEERLAVLLGVDPTLVSNDIRDFQ
jgi:ABC-type amino acid transport substrate-binding protein